MRYGRRGRARGGPDRAPAAPRPALEGARVARRGCRKITLFDRHRVEVVRQAEACPQRLSRRCLRLRSGLSAGATRSSTCRILSCCQGTSSCRERPQHHPRRPAAAQRQRAGAPRLRPPRAPPRRGPPRRLWPRHRHRQAPGSSCPPHVHEVAVLVPFDDDLRVVLVAEHAHRGGAQHEPPPGVRRQLEPAGASAPCST